METIIRAKNIFFKYSFANVLENVSFEIKSGDFLAIIGSNGSGKSTLIKLITGELTLQSGSMEINGVSIKDFKDWRMLSYVPQNSTSGFDGFPATVLEVVKSGLYGEAGLFSFGNNSHKQRALDALKAVDMDAYASRNIGKLSGGQMQRVMLARALVSNPQLLILDEPTTGVDIETSEKLYELLKKMNIEQELTVIMVTHDLARAVKYISRAFCVEECSLVELSNEEISAELVHKHKHPHGGHRHD